MASVTPHSETRQWRNKSNKWITKIETFFLHCRKQLFTAYEANNSYMLFAGWESVWWKSVTEVLKMLPEAAGQGQHFQAPGHSFSPYRLTVNRQITCLFCFPAVNRFYRLQMGLFTQLLSLNWLARRLLTIWKRSWQRASNSDSRQRKMY